MNDVAFSADNLHTGSVLPHVTWMADAACRDQDPDLFFPLSTRGVSVEQINEAKRICEDCVVRETCLNYALDVPHLAGIWGGHTEEERLRLQRRKSEVA